MTDQGWMVDDGTCLSCVEGQCWLCTKPVELYLADDVDWTGWMCCCDEGYDLGPKQKGDPQ